MADKKERIDASRRKLFTGAFNRLRGKQESETVVAETESALPALKKAEVAYRAGEYGSAVDHYRAFLAVETNNTEARFRLGRCLYKLEKYLQAKVEFERVLYLKRQDNDAFLFLGLTLCRLDRPQKAVALWRQFFDTSRMALQREVNVQLGLLEMGEDEAPSGVEIAMAIEAVLDRPA